jgi:hypothetical protein
VSVDRIDEWLETPMFEPDPDEKWEEMATSARAPLRLAAGLRLRMTARAAKAARAARDGDGRPNSPASAPPKPGGSPTGAELRRGAAPAPAPQAAPAPAPQAEPVGTREAEQVRAAGGGLRTRLSGALDRWAAAEVEAGARLERLLLPKRWHDVGGSAASGPTLDGVSKLQLRHRL